MTNKTIIPITEARKNIFKVVNAASCPGVHYLLTERGKPKAVIMGADEYESWMETMEVREHIPDILNDVKRARRAIKTGSYKKFTTLQELKEKYGLSNRPLVQRRKRAR